MNFQNNRYVFEPAKPEDGKEILEILEENDFKGRVSLIYTRRPDAYISIKKEADEVDIIVWRDLKSNRLVGFGACAIRNLYVNGKEERVGYLFGLRVRSEYRKRTPQLFKGYEALSSIYKDRNIPFFYTTILEENNYAQRVLEKRRSFMPDYEYFGSYVVYMLKTRKKLFGLTDKLFKRAEEKDRYALVEFMNNEGKRRNFFPVINQNDLISGKIPGIRLEDFYILYNEGEIIAAGAVWDQREYKQYVVEGYSGSLKYLQPVSFLFPAIGYPSLPQAGSVLNFFTLSFCLVRNNDPDIFKRFINNISTIAQGYSFFIVGIYEGNPLEKVLSNIPHISYKSRAYFVDWEKKNTMKERIDMDMPLHLECGML